MLRRLDDVDGMRANMLNGVMKAVQDKFPVKNSQYTLHVKDLEYDTMDPASLKDQKQALLHGDTLSHKLMGTWQLVNNETGEPVEERRTVVAHVPMVTQRGTFVYNGSEYAVGNQLRLRPGPYTRIANTGEAETHVNVLPGTGRAFRVQLEPESGIFKLKTGQSHVPLLPILRALGTSDDQIAKAWGTELFNMNSRAAAKDTQAVNKVYDRWVGRKVPGEDQVAAIHSQLSRMQVDDDILQSNLGKYLTPETQNAGTVLTQQPDAQNVPALPVPDDDLSAGLHVREPGGYGDDLGEQDDNRV